MFLDNLLNSNLIKVVCRFENNYTFRPRSLLYLHVEWFKYCTTIRVCNTSEDRQQELERISPKSESFPEFMSHSIERFKG